MNESFGLLCYGGLMIAVAAISVLVYNILWPVIIYYPWEAADAKEEKSNQTVIFAASYNPPHFGHLAMLEYLSTRYSKVIAVVGFNPNKLYLVSPEERAELLREMLKSTLATNIQVEVVEGYIWRYAKRVGATLFCRGIRSWEKDGRDERSLQFLNTWGPLLLGPLNWPIPTIYLEGNPKYNHVSSTLIRQICIRAQEQQQLVHDDDGATGTTQIFSKDKEAALTQLVPENTARRVAELYGK